MSVAPIAPRAACFVAVVALLGGCQGNVPGPVNARRGGDGAGGTLNTNGTGGAGGGQDSGGAGGADAGEAPRDAAPAADTARPDAADPAADAPGTLADAPGTGGDAGTGPRDTAAPDAPGPGTDASIPPPSDAGTPPRDGDGPAAPNGIVGVGYGGIRIVSRDLGRTWGNETHWAASGGDDKNLLRSIAYGNGIWVAGGWRYVTSADGVTWTDRGNAIDVIRAVRCDITDSMAFGAGRFVVACGSNLATSTDGLAWERLGSTPSVGGHPTLVFDAASARFAVSGDNDQSYVSSDGGKTWTALDGVSHVRLCRGGLRAESECPAFFASDVFLGTVWSGVIRRSTDGNRWTNVYSDPSDNTLFTDYAFAVGVVAAP